MLINILPSGYVECLYTDKINLRNIGSLDVRRASNVEFDNNKQGWMVDIELDGAILGPFESREVAIQAEVEYIENNILTGDGLCKSTRPDHKE